MEQGCSALRALGVLPAVDIAVLARVSEGGLGGSLALDLAHYKHGFRLAAAGCECRLSCLFLTGIQGVLGYTLLCIGTSVGPAQADQGLLALGGWSRQAVWWGTVTEFTVWRCSTACRAACLIATVSILGCALLLCTALPFLGYVLSALCPRFATAHVFMDFEGRCYVVLLFPFVLYSQPLASWLHT